MELIQLNKEQFLQEAGYEHISVLRAMKEDQYLKWWDFNFSPYTAFLSVCTNVLEPQHLYLELASYRKICKRVDNILNIPLENVLNDNSGENYYPLLDNYLVEEACLIPCDCPYCYYVPILSEGTPSKDLSWPYRICCEVRAGLLMLIRTGGKLFKFVYSGTCENPELYVLACGQTRYEALERAILKIPKDYIIIGSAQIDYFDENPYKEGNSEGIEKLIVYPLNLEALEKHNSRYTLRGQM